MAVTRREILANLRAKIARKEPVIGGGAGTGISAKCEEAGGIDLIVIYNSGRYRMAGRGSLAGLLAYGNANDIVLELAREVLPVVKKVPVLAGINGTDPFVNWDAFLRRIREEGFAGVQNFPTVGLIDGLFRANHASNYLPLKITYPEGKAAGLKTIEAALAGEIGLKPEWFRAL